MGAGLHKTSVRVPFVASLAILLVLALFPCLARADSQLGMQQQQRTPSHKYHLWRHWADSQKAHRTAVWSDQLFSLGTIASRTPEQFSNCKDASGTVLKTRTLTALCAGISCTYHDL